MVQEVLNEHKLPPTFSRDVWRLCMDWLCADPNGVHSDPAKQQNIALAAARDPDVATVNDWRRQADPIAPWAAAVDKEMPRWGVEICNAGWLPHLERALWMIGHETALPGKGPGWCGEVPMARRQWAVMFTHALDEWLANRPKPDGSAVADEVYALLDGRDDDKAGAAAFLRDVVHLAATQWAQDFDAAFKALTPPTPLAQQLRKPVRYAQFSCGYRWEKVALDLCRWIGDPAYRESKPIEFRVGTCNGQIGFAGRDDPARVPATCGILAGLWAWLRDAPPDAVRQAYPLCAVLAERTREQLGKSTPVKRRLAGRLFIGIRIWLQEYDQGDVKQPQPAMTPYPTLSPD